MKKTITIILIFACIMTALVSCGKAQSDNSGKASTTDASGVDPLPGGEGAITSDYFAVALISRGEPLADGQTDEFRASFDKAAEALALRPENIYGIRDEFPDEASFLETVSELADKKCPLIFTADRSLMDYTGAAAEKYPDIQFVNFGGYLTNDTNLINRRVRLYQASYLCGIAAAFRTLETNGGAVGYVCDGTDAEDRANVNAFALGVQAAVGPLDMEMPVMLRIVQPDHQPGEEEAAANELLQSGCTVIGGLTENSEYLNAVVQAGAKGTACGGGTEAVPPETLIASAVFDHSGYFEKVVSAVMSGHRESIDKTPGDFADGELSLSASLDGESDVKAKALIDVVTGLLTDREWDVFCGRTILYDFQERKIVVSQFEEKTETDRNDYPITAPDGSIDDGVLFETMDYYVYGIISGSDDSQY
ncbi:MAG: BMP family ABC transporter substrate-binding protein [Clostridia bacterium]|nr:BMP family ABC transporter substrate-binding protein [Clostridia bacterium]